MNGDTNVNSPSAWSALSFAPLPGPAQFTSPLSLYRTSSNMSIKSNATLNSFYNVNNASLTLKQDSSMLPYRVIEALSASSRTLKNLSARISDSGWAWLVSGRRLFVWRYFEDCSASLTKPKASKCYELSLPPSDIAHKAELICVLTSFEQKNKFPSALAVSPEGSIRYWPNISQEGNTFDSIVTADLQGQECLSLVDIQPLGCMLGTTTSSLVHICLSTNPNETGSGPIVCRTMKAPQGILSGIGRKVSSFIFGSLPTTHLADSKQLIRIARNHVMDDIDDVLPLYIFVMSNCIIQKWEIDDNDSENLVAEIDLERYIKEAFISKLWNRSTTHHNQLTLLPLDLALKRSNEVVLLVMCNNSDCAAENHFALFTLNSAIFNSSADGSLTSLQTDSNGIFTSFRIIPNIALLEGNDPLHSDASTGSLLSSQSAHLNILSGTADDQYACYIYDSSKIYRINHSEDEDDFIQEIDFQLSGDYLLGAVAVNQSPLLFTFKNGFVSIHSNQADLISTKQLSAMDREFINSNNTDKISVLKRALQLFAKGEKLRSELMVQELFPWIASNQRPTSNVELDDVVCAVSADICDHIPHQDPRWAHASDGTNADGEISGEESNSVNYVIITNQLEDKLVTHRLFIELLQVTGAWEALTSLTTVFSILPSKLLLCEHAEKLIVSLNLRKHHIKYAALLEVAIRKVLDKRSMANSAWLQGAHLTPQDLFYREVTKIEDIFWSLIELENETLSQDQSNWKASQSVILSITDVITSVFSEVCLYRQSNGAIYQSAAMADCDYVPWSSAEHVSGVRETLLKQFDLLIKCSAIDQNTYIAAKDQSKYNSIGQKIVDLADIILDSYASQLSCLNASNEKFSVLKSAFQSNRFDCLMPLLRLKQYDKAASLAEKYEDFDILIKICEELNNQEQLQQYIEQFANKGFSEHLFEWYLKEGKQGKMLSTVANNYKLTDFLSNHESLNWLHQIHLAQFKEASSTLKKLGVLEDNYPARRKTLLSIGKLALIASRNCDYSDFDDQIKFINFQQDLSESLLRKRGLDRNTLKVLSPEQLVDILTSGSEGPNQDIDNFKRALEIADLIEKRFSLQTHREAILKIWRRAFLKDDWACVNTDNYEVPIKQSFFYQLTFAQFGNHPKKLPPLQDLIDNFEAASNEKTSFFLRATYELILH